MFPSPIPILQTSREFSDLDAGLQPLYRPPNIEEVHPELAATAYDRQVIRDVVSGSRAVKRKGEIYLHRTRDNQGDDEYRRIVHNTVFFPATARTAEGKMGLMLARNVTLDAPLLEPIKNNITNTCASVIDLTRKVIWDTLQTNFTGLLVDHPNSTQSVNQVDAVAKGARPYVHVFPAETIYWIDYSYSTGVRVPTRIVVRQTFDTILELMIEDGIYKQRLWQDTLSTGFKPVSETVPFRDGQPLDRIPWVTVSDNNEPWPQDSVLYHIAELNLDHYRAQAQIANLSLFASAVVPFVTGLKLDRDPATGLPLDPKLTLTTGGVLIIEDAQGKLEMAEARGHMAATLQKRSDDLEDMIAKQGSRVMATEKEAPESPDVVAMRNMGENAITASQADVYGRRISEALSWAAWWMDPNNAAFTGQEATLTLNTDYGNDAMDGPLLTAWTAAYQAGGISQQTYLEGLQDAGRVRKTLNIKDEIGRVEVDIADRPPVTPTKPAVTDGAAE